MAFRSTFVRGQVLRDLRRRSYPSADAFAAACGSVSVPTVYRAERGGPVLWPYLERMARVLEVPVYDLAVPADATPVAGDMTGEWFGLYVRTDRFGKPAILTEVVRLRQSGARVEGFSGHIGCNRAHCDTFTDCIFADGIFTGRIVSVDWRFPLDAPAFVLSRTREMTWLDGYLTWYDMDSQRAEVSRYHLIRKDRPRFDDDVKEARETLDTEIRLHLLRKSIEAGLSFDHAIRILQ